MKYLATLLLTYAVCMGASFPVQISWQPLGPTRIDVLTNGVSASSQVVGGTNAVIDMDLSIPGTNVVTVTTLGSMNWFTNAITGQVMSTNVVLESKPSNAVRVIIPEQPTLRVRVEAYGEDGEWTPVGVILKLELGEIDHKFLRMQVIDEEQP